ncbi:F-box protein SKIP28-like [Aristolochia californica]|uniref:F-box protein SKIP28-like n=1 Tax=Aristolochia californica TaxID=171875 RepID=UPI0035DB53A6
MPSPLCLSTIKTMEETLQKAHQEPSANSQMSLFSSGSSFPQDHMQRFSGPHEALFYSLPYLYLRELFGVRRVCKSLRQAVDEDDLLWQNVRVDVPLSRKLTDDHLLSITSKARGKLRSLVLIDCGGITDAGLRRVVDDNPHITGLYVPGCTGLSPTGIINMVERLPKLERIAVHGVLNMTDHLENLNSLLHDNHPRPPTYYTGRPSHSPLNLNKNPIDVQICPKCEEARLVFDCTRETCKEKMKKKQVSCRGCYWCISRCELCGGCVDFDDEPPELIACQHALCSNCWLGVPKCVMCNRGSCCRDVRNGEPAGFTCAGCFLSQEKCLESEDESP